MALMCQGELALESIEIGHLVDFQDYFAAELAALDEFVQAGLVGIEPGWITVTPRGRFFLRGICMVFDRHLQSGRQRGSFSKII
jgi:oxygen-independent coproporphyrinogen-3 oxidase